MDNISATMTPESNWISVSNRQPFDNQSPTVESYSSWSSGPLPGLFWQIMYSIIAVLGIIGNSLVVFVFSRVAGLRNLTSLFLVSLAIADFITCVVLIPLHLGIEIPVPEGAAGKALCRLLLSKFPLWTSFTASVLNLACVTLERYFSIVYPLRYDTIFTFKRALFMIVTIWFIAFFLNSYMLYIFFPDDGTCVIEWPSYGLQVLVGVGNFFFIYAIPITVIFVCYVRMMKALSLSEEGTTESTGRASRACLELQGARKRLVKMLAIVCVTFAVCWAPNQFVFLAYNLGWKDMDFESWYYHATVLIASFNSCCNPFIYVFRSKQYRRALVVAICGQKAFHSTVDCAPDVIAPSIAATADMIAVNQDFRWSSGLRGESRRSDNLEPTSTRIELEENSEDTLNASQISAHITVKAVCHYTSYVDINRTV
ncbi:galanin receptor 2a-like [Amphiura filiformis]|uniref:galanin receptor 2a-like n=1 Tax=Amphiura filiformis TaxID=82378 RepID=UPI003B21D320